MALIKCLECGKEISDTATSCPYCGTKDTQESSGLLRDFMQLMLFALIIYTVIDSVRGFPIMHHIWNSIPKHMIIFMK